jgi:hypothetical protein
MTKDGSGCYLIHHSKTKFEMIESWSASRSTQRSLNFDDSKLVNPVKLIKRKKESINIKYHHFGICTNFKKMDSDNLKEDKLNFLNHQANPYRIQWINYAWPRWSITNHSSKQCPCGISSR